MGERVNDLIRDGQNLFKKKLFIQKNIRYLWILYHKHVVLILINIIMLKNVFHHPKHKNKTSLQTTSYFYLSLAPICSYVLAGRSLVWPPGPPAPLLASIHLTNDRARESFLHLNKQEIEFFTNINNFHLYIYISSYFHLHFHEFAQFFFPRGGSLCF